MKIDFTKALEVLEEEIEQANSIKTEGFWIEIVQELSEECKDKNKTMIAMLGTALLAKATCLEIDPFSLQVGEDRTSNTYSARALCKDVLAANSKRLGIDLGVSGREPLNNQPFFGKIRITPDFKVRSDAQKAFNILLRALQELDSIRTNKQARLALRAFIQVRKTQRKSISVSEEEGDEYSLFELIRKIELFVEENSEGGKRAQAVSSGLLDVLYGTERVDAKRINDPSRNMPGDIGIFVNESKKNYERVFEVKDKPITIKDIQILIDSVQSSSVTIVGMIATSSLQENIDFESAIRWAESRMVRLKIYIGWHEFVIECLFWASLHGLTNGAAYRSILKRLEFYEVTADGIDYWKK